MNKTLRIIIFVIAALIFCTSIGILGWYFLNRHKEEQKVDELKDLITTEETKDTGNSTEELSSEEASNGLNYYLIDDVIVQEKYKDIYLRNSDFIGWIKIDDTKVDYPVVYTPEDEDFYLRKNFDGDYSIAGTIFVAGGTDLYRPSENIILYGHQMTDNSMFGSIDKYEDEDYYKEHKYIKFNHLQEDAIYEVIAAYKTVSHNMNEYDGFDVYGYVNLDRDKFDYFVSESKKATKYNTSDVKYGDNLIMLSTCSYHTANGRFVVLAKKVNSVKVDLTKDPLEVIKTK